MKWRYWWGVICEVWPTVWPGLLLSFGLPIATMSVKESTLWMAFAGGGMIGTGLAELLDNLTGYSSRVEDTPPDDSCALCGKERPFYTVRCDVCGSTACTDCRPGMTPTICINCWDASIDGFAPPGEGG